MILLPGFDGTGVLYGPLLRALPPEIMPTVVGYPLDRACSADELLDIALRSLPKSEAYVLVAESFSGPIALRVALQRAPEALVLCASFARYPLPRPLIAALAMLGRTIFRFRPPEWFVRRYLLGDAPSDVLDLFYAAIAMVSPDVLAHRFSVLLQFNERYTPGEILFPILYLQATRDRLVGAHNARFLQRQYPHVRVERIDSPHLLFQAQPQPALRAILAFLDRGEP
jgi:pimeloyl-ACP methyl ester carboxylesterase